MLSESSPEEEEIQMIPLQMSTQNKRPHPYCHLCELETGGECSRCDSQDLGFDDKDSNDLLYHRHKRAHLCLVCGALM